MEADLGNPRQRSQHNVLNAGLRGCGHGDCVPIAPQARSYPENIDLGDGWRFAIRATRRSHGEDSFLSMRNPVPHRNIYLSIIGLRRHLRNTTGTRALFTLRVFGDSGEYPAPA